MLRALIVAIGLAASAQVLSAEHAPQPLPRICRADDPAMACIGPFVAYRYEPEYIYLSGGIWDDAPAALLRMLRFQPKAKVLVLDSDGGYIDPALIVAKEVRARGLDTYVMQGTECNSACAYVFLAGTNRRVDGRLGVHQLASSDNDLAKGQVALAEVFTTLRAFGVSDGVISLMLATKPDDMHHFTRTEMAALAIEHGDPFAQRAVATPQVTPEDRLAADPTATSDAPSLAVSAPTTADSVPSLDPTLNPAGTQSLLLEASDDGKTGAVPFSGVLEWRQGRDLQGKPTVAGTAYIPARNLGVDILIRRNADKSIPAAIVIEVKFRVSNSFVGGSVAGLPGVLLKNEELVQGAPLVGASARVVGNSFLFALSASPEDTAANSALLTSRKWIDLAVIYATGKRAIITLEKDSAAQEMFRNVFADWLASGEARRIEPFGIPENVTTVPMTKTGLSEPARLEKLIKVDEEGGIAAILLRSGFTAQTSEMMLATLRETLGAGRLMSGTWLRFLFGPSRASDTLIPYRLSVYSPSNGTTSPRHLATAALTDRGTYVLGLAPPEISFPGEPEPTRSMPKRNPDGKGDRSRPVAGATR